MVVAVLPGCASHNLRFEDLCAPLRPKLYARAMQLSRDPHTAQDLVQDTLLNAFLGWSRFAVPPGEDPSERVAWWLFRILKNAFLSSYRKTRLREEGLASYAEMPDSAVCNPGTFADSAEFIDGDVLTVLDSLSGYRREVVRRMDLGGQTYQEVFLATGVNVRTLKSGRNRAHRKLATVLGLAPGRPRTKGSK